MMMMVVLQSVELSFGEARAEQALPMAPAIKQNVVLQSVELSIGEGYRSPPRNSKRDGPEPPNGDHVVVSGD